MVHGTGLPTNIAQLDLTTLHGQPVLVQIMSITEIGVSAHRLNQTMQTRMERMAAGEVEEGDGDVDVEGEGLPNYPREMLKFELSDGATILRAIEYRALPELALGVTPLGYKVVCVLFDMFYLFDVFLSRCFSKMSLSVEGSHSSNLNA
jgi:RecQ-mediated genome instability protein 1